MKARFYKAVNNIKREGIDDLTAWLESTDFFVAPASTVYHQNYEGGLLEHSLNVYDNLVKLCEFYNVEYTQEEIAIVALFHDLCKINTFEKTQRGYKIKEQYAFGGHGSKSVYLTMKHMQLTDVEAAAINAHMGAWDNSYYNNCTRVYETNTLAWLLHVADEQDTYMRKK